MVNNHKNRVEKWRIQVLYILIALIFGYFILRLFNLQIINADIYISQAEENRTKEVSIAAERGIIFDRNGIVLARNVASYNVTITPADLPGDPTEVPLPGAIEEIYRELSQVIDIPVSAGVFNEETVKLFTPCQTDFGITEIVTIADTNAPYMPVRVVCDVDQETAMIVKENATDWSGVDIEVQPIREYPTGELTAEVIGFLGPIPAALEEEYEALGFVPNRDKVGYAGVESSLNEVLAGRNGLRVVEVDVAGKELRDLEPPVEPETGKNVVLSIDTRLQAAAKAALVGEIEWWNRYFNEIRSSNGVAIAMNPKTGEILALVSYPTFENNRMARFIPAYYYEQLSQDPNRPLFNHAISAEHPPGSVYKLAAAIGAMNEGVLSPTDSVECPGTGRITVLEKYAPNDPGKPQDYFCYDELGHGRVSYLRAIALSCDIYFYKISGGYPGEVPEGLGIDRMAEYARALGYGQVSGIELPGEMEGLVPTSSWKRINMSENWSIGDTYIAAMGQGFVLATPLQVLISASIVANDGVYMQPTLVHEIQDAEGSTLEPFEPEIKWDLTKDPLITVFDEDGIPTEEKKTVEPWVIDLTQEGMRMAVTEGTAESPFRDFVINGEEIALAGKTGTAEYCDDVAQAKDLCQPENWPTHSWYVGYGPYEDPEIAVVAFVYNGGEGASVAAPIVRNIMEAYFELKAIDEGTATGE